MSEKKIIILSVLGICLLATCLMYLMLQKDFSKQKLIITQQQNEINQQQNLVPKIEIETRK